MKSRRKRMLSPEIWQNLQFQSLNHAEQSLYIFLISTADDYGIRPANSNLIKGEWAWSKDDITPRTINAHLRAIHRTGLICVYGEGELKFIQHPKWHIWQKITNPSRKHYPDCSGCSSCSESADDREAFYSNEPSKPVRVKESREAKEVFDYYCEVFGDVLSVKKIKFPGKQQKILTRLQSFSKDDLKKCIDMMKMNLEHWDKQRGYLEMNQYLFRNDERVEFWLNKEAQLKHLGKDKTKQIASITAKYLD